MALETFHKVLAMTDLSESDAKEVHNDVAFTQRLIASREELLRNDSKDSEVHHVTCTRDCVLVNRVLMCVCMCVCVCVCNGCGHLQLYRRAVGIELTRDVGGESAAQPEHVIRRPERE